MRSTELGIQCLLVRRAKEVECGRGDCNDSGKVGRDYGVMHLARDSSEEQWYDLCTCYMPFIG